MGITLNKAKRTMTIQAAALPGIAEAWMFLGRRERVT